MLAQEPSRKQTTVANTLDTMPQDLKAAVLQRLMLAKEPSQKPGRFMAQVTNFSTALLQCLMLAQEPLQVTT